MLIERFWEQNVLALFNVFHLFFPGTTSTQRPQRDSLYEKAPQGAIKNDIFKSETRSKFWIGFFHERFHIQHENRYFSLLCFELHMLDPSRIRLQRWCQLQDHSHSAQGLLWSGVHVWIFSCPASGKRSSMVGIYFLNNLLNYFCSFHKPLTNAVSI